MCFFPSWKTTCHLCQQHLDGGGSLTGAAPHGTMEETNTESRVKMIKNIPFSERMFGGRTFRSPVRDEQFNQLSVSVTILFSHQQCNPC